jgi:DNA primase
MPAAHAQKSRDEIDALKARFDIVVEAQRLVPSLRRQGREYVGLSPFKPERTPSFTVDPAKGVFYCFCTSQGGDVIDLIAKTSGIDRGEAIRRMKADCAMVTDDEIKRRADAHRRQSAARDEADRQAKTRKAVNAVAIWRDARRGDGTDVERYLAWRGIDLDAIEAVYGWRVPRSLRLVPSLDYWDVSQTPPRVTHVGPAMVGGLSATPPDADGAMAVAAIHRTWLGPKGQGKFAGGPAKLTLGPVSGTAGWLHCGPDHLILGEGYETTLTVMAALAGRGLAVSAASAVSLSNMAGAGVGQGEPHPDGSGRRLPSERPDWERPGFVPSGPIRMVTLLADADGKDRPSSAALIKRAAFKLRQRKFRVKIAWPEAGTDFNDMLKSGGGPDVARAVELALP